MKDLFLAVDVGTQSIRAIVFSADGSIAIQNRVFIEPYFSTKPGWAEQRPEYFYEKLCETTLALFRQNSQYAGRIRACGITTQRCTVVNVDKNGNPLRPAIVWPDQRRTDKIRKITGIMGIALRLIGMHETVRFAQSESELNWLHAFQPEIMEKTHKYLYLSGYLLFRMTGRFIDSTASQVGYVPFDYKNFTWYNKKDWHWTAFPVDRDKLVDLAEPSALIGTISSRVSSETGIPAGTDIIASGSDKTCEFLGTGCLSPEKAGISFGTTATIGTYSKKYFEATPFIPPYPSAIPGMYNAEFQIYRGFWLVSWFKNEFGIREIEKAEKAGTAPEVFLNELLDEAPAGSLGLMLQPTWSPGVKIPGPEAKGAIIGFGDAHTRAHMYRSIIEGLCFGLKSGGERIQKSSKIPFTEIRVSGGGAQSPRTLQITADIFNLPVIKPHVHDTSSLGVAIDCAVGCKIYPDFEHAVHGMTRIDTVFYPESANVALYKRLYEEVYIHIYEKLKSYYQKIREITGYPD
ncbi:MAG: FGGY-family carbohydrate kinase [Spirochaetales bacterium]|nr:FGGY-family carbohydrate kinase [Spirochaetales bacterium]